VKKPSKKRCMKAMVVKAELTVQKVGTIQICAPLGVIADPKTGVLKTPVDLRLLGRPVFTPTVVPCKLINHGLQKACLLVQKRVHSGCEYSVASKVDLDIPIFAMHDVPHILPGDEVQEKAEVESIDIRGIRDPNSQDCEERTILIITVVYKVHVIFSREESICVPEHCKKKEDDCCIDDEDCPDTTINKNNIKIIVNPWHHSSQEYSW